MTDLSLFYHYEKLLKNCDFIQTNFDFWLFCMKIKSGLCSRQKNYNFACENVPGLVRTSFSKFSTLNYRHDP